MNAEPVSVIIPVYQQSETVLKNLSGPLNDNRFQGEVIIAVDEPTENFLKELNKFKNIKLIISKERRGKVNALNQAVQSSSGEYLLFIDSDVLLPDNIIYESLIEIENYDILDFSKVGTIDSRLSKITSIDYLEANIISEMFSKLSHKTFLMDGAAFLIRRSAFQKLGGFNHVVSEDFDIATRSHKIGLKYKMTANIKVNVGQPSTFNDWFMQRIRWAYGMGEWLKQNLKYLFRMIVYSPIIVISAILITLPTLTMGIIFYAISSKMISSYFITYAYYVIPESFIPIREYALNAYHADAGKVIMASISAFIILLPFYYYLSLRYGGRFSPLNFAIYYFIYQPILLAVFLIGISLSFMNITPDIDWIT